ncbi:MAG: hypothetical protein H7330_11515 [Hymenobacteraceae bacterium]|nr:hypothetical protein [Hymenobacteraceae bacterium]
MSVVTFETLLRLAFGERYDNFFTETETTAYTRFERAVNGRLPPGAPAHEPSFAFERVRLAVAMALLQLLLDLAHEAHPDGQPPNASLDDDEAAVALKVLHRALREAHSPAEIDTIVAAEADVFERLYTDLFVNDAGEQVLLLFERTLHADTRRELDGCLSEAAKLAQALAL